MRGALSLLIAGRLPTRGQPAAIQCHLNGSGDPALLSKVRSFDKAYAIATGRRRT